MTDADYDVEAFDDGRRAGYMQGRVEAERRSVHLVAALVAAAGGRIEIPDSVLTADIGGELHHYRSEANRCEVYEVAPPPVSAGVGSKEQK